MRESDLAAPIRKFMRQELGCTRIKKELNVGSHRIDLVGLKGEEIIAVELKLHDWRHIIKQAWRNRVCSHWSYVALPVNVTDHIITKEFERFGIGICTVRGSRVTITSEPDRSPCLEPFLQTVMEQMGS